MTEHSAETSAPRNARTAGLLYLVLIGSGYESNLLLPHNAQGWNGLNLMQKEVSHEEDFNPNLKAADDKGGDQDDGQTFEALLHLFCVYFFAQLLEKVIITCLQARTIPQDSHFWKLFLTPPALGTQRRFRFRAYNH